MSGTDGIAQLKTNIGEHEILTKTNIKLGIHKMKKIFLPTITFTLMLLVSTFVYSSTETYYSLNKQFWKNRQNMDQATLVSIMKEIPKGSLIYFSDKYEKNILKLCDFKLPVFVRKNADLEVEKGYFVCYYTGSVRVAK